MNFIMKKYHMTKPLSANSYKYSNNLKCIGSVLLHADPRLFKLFTFITSTTIIFFENIPSTHRNDIFENRNRKQTFNPTQNLRRN